jgi:dienelactone hydrolase
MKSRGAWALLAALLWAGVAAAQQAVSFPSAGDNGATPPTALTGYLFRPAGNGPFPAIVFAHGCYGMFARGNAGNFLSRDIFWATTMSQQGYVVLMVDSFGPRQHGEMCSTSGFDEQLYVKRPRDAYGALAYLQAQPFVQPDRVGIMGWSQGGGVVLLSIRAASLGRPAGLPPNRDFRAAVAFYPASCNDKSHSQPWTSSIPLLVLMGTGDVWTAAGPCQEFLQGVKGRGSPVESVFYPGAYHDFDFPGDQPVRNLPQYTTRSGVVPITGTDPVARADALQRVPAFFATYLKGR